MIIAVLFIISLNHKIQISNFTILKKKSVVKNPNFMQRGKDYYFVFTLPRVFNKNFTTKTFLIFHQRLFIWKNVFYCFGFAVITIVMGKCFYVQIRITHD